MIRANRSGETSVYNINGQVMRASVTYTEGETRISGLGAGVDAVAGQTVVLK